jgi:hypothetical protein
MRSFSAKGSLGLEWLGRYRPRRGDCIELVRVVQHCRFGGACGPRVVVARDGVQQLCACIRLQARGALLDRAQAEVDVPEQPSFLGLSKRRSRRELGDASEVVQQGSR